MNRQQAGRQVSRWMDSWMDGREMTGKRFATVEDVKQAVMSWPQNLDTNFVYLGFISCRHGAKKA
jgi:hypothetical protein